MDADHDGRIDADEARRYAQNLTERTADALALSIGLQNLDLVPLHTPELDLNGVAQVVPAHHLVRLFYFARTPATMGQGSQLTVDDGLWPATPAVTMLSVRGNGGVRGRVLASAAAEGAASRRLGFQIEAVPNVSADQVLTGTRTEPDPVVEGRAVGYVSPVDHSHGLSFLSAALVAAAGLFVCARAQRRAKE